MTNFFSELYNRIFAIDAFPQSPYFFAYSWFDTLFINKLTTNYRWASFMNAIRPIDMIQLCGIARARKAWRIGQTLCYVRSWKNDSDYFIITENLLHFRPYLRNYYRWETMHILYFQKKAPSIMIIEYIALLGQYFKTNSNILCFHRHMLTLQKHYILITKLHNADD